jgi:hypothetical protein
MPVGVALERDPSVFDDDLYLLVAGGRQLTRSGEAIWHSLLSAINTGEVGPDDFVVAATGTGLTQSGRRRFVDAFERRLSQETTHPVFGYQVSMRRMLLVQARLLSRFLLGELPSYPHWQDLVGKPTRSQKARIGRGGRMRMAAYATATEAHAALAGQRCVKERRGYRVR